MTTEQVGEILVRELFETYKVTDTAQLIEVLTYMLVETTTLVAHQTDADKAAEYLHLIKGFTIAKLKRDEVLKKGGVE